MIQTAYFYRELLSEKFLQTENPKTIIPVRLKNDFNPEHLYYSENKKEWISIPENAGDKNIFSEENLGGYAVEFVEFPIEPDMSFLADCDFIIKDYQTGDFKDPELEDFSPSQMQKFLEYRRQKKRHIFNKENFKDKNGVEKDIHSAKISVDTENLTLTISFYKFIRSENRKTEIFREVPATEEKKLFFDMKNGEADLISDYQGKDYCIKKKNGSWYEIRSYSLEKEKFLKDKKLSDGELYNKIVNICNSESRELPVCVLKSAFEKLLELAESFTGVSFDDRRNAFKTKKDVQYLLEMYRLTMLPFEPALYEIIVDSELQKQPVIFKYKRSDSKIFKRFCRKYKIRNTKILRKCFMERPSVLLTFVRLKDSGFKDMNLYNRVLTAPDNCLIIDSCDATSLAFFCRWSIKKRGQKNTLNSILKDANRYAQENAQEAGLDLDINFMNIHNYTLTDALDMFCKYFKHIPDSLKEDILKDGFTEFNHDALANISWQYEHKNVTFKYTYEEKRLEDEIDGYKFCLPENSYQLCEIGTALHNCVASYADRVKEKECTIVYAAKDDKYKICIELQGKKICQERTDHNELPEKEEQKVLYKWHDRHALVH